ncbi:hypothetical protein [Pseudoalteromonas pernae]|uniref:hypothetical protein n=1 Tax=Pseudoalteromonas pernae TaxID=3118054 RepID=UPI003242E5A2
MSQTELSFKQRNKLNTLNLAKWTTAWVLTLAVASFGPHLMWSKEQTVISIIAVAVNVLVGVMMIIANKKQVLGLDEMQQRIQLNAMGITLGASVVFGLAYSVVQSSGILNYDEDISHLVIFMSLTYLTTLIVMNKRLNDEGEE